MKSSGLKILFVKMANDMFAETLQNLQPSMWIISESQNRISDSSSKNLRARTLYDVPSLPIYCLPAKFNVIYLFIIIIALQSASMFQWAEFLATDPEVRVRFPALPDFF
jgi:hypothetical protein